MYGSEVGFLASYITKITPLLETLRKVLWRAGELKFVTQVYLI